MPSFSQDEFQIADTQKHTCDTSVQDWAMGLNISCAHYVYVYNGCRSQEMMQYEPWHNPATLVESFVSHVHVFFLSLMQAFLNSASVCTIMYWCELSTHSKECKNTSLHTSTLWFPTGSVYRLENDLWQSCLFHVVIAVLGFLWQSTYLCDTHPAMKLLCTL